MEIAEAIFPILAILTLGIATAVLSRMVKVNPIVGYLFLGMVVSAVHPEPLSAEGTVHLLAELGVVFLLFDIDLHFSTAHVRREASDIFGFGPLQVGASTILIGGCVWAFGLSPIAALVVGTTLALSSTAIVAGVIADHRQQNCPVALTAIAILDLSGCRGNIWPPVLPLSKSGYEIGSCRSRRDLDRRRFYSCNNPDAGRVIMIPPFMIHDR